MTSNNLVTVSDFSIFFRDCYQRIFHFVERYIGDPLVADDLTQDTFLKVYERFDGFETTLHARSFAYTVARNLSLDYIKHQRVKQGYAALPQEEEDNSFYHQISYVETVNTVRTALTHLSQRSRDIIELSMDGKSTDEIAASLGISVNTVKTLKKRAYQKLRELLASRYKSLLFLSALLGALLCWLLS